MAGSGATTQGNAGAGGMAFANVPVSGPVAITVGAGGNGTHPSARGGIGGAILVEYVG